MNNNKMSFADKRGELQVWRSRRYYVWYNINKKEKTASHFIIVLVILNSPFKIKIIKSWVEKKGEKKNFFPVRLLFRVFGRACTALLYIVSYLNLTQL